MYNYEINYNRTLLIDGSYQLHRCLSIPSYFDMRNSEGIGTGGVLGVLMTIQKELKYFNYYPIVVFDGGLSQRRLDIYPNYKKYSEKQQLLECKEEYKTPEEILNERFMHEYKAQREILIKLLPLLGIPCIRLDNWEGDDLLYILSKMSKDSIVVSDDKDLIQLIADEKLGNKDRSCIIRRSMNDEILTADKFLEEYDSVYEFIGCKAIVGDPSDNLANACIGIGNKYAHSLLKLIECIAQDEGDFPDNESGINVVCQMYKIPKRKAYINFNYDQFVINYLLTDLQLVDEEVTDDIITAINMLIMCNNINNALTNEEELNIILNDLEIKSFDYKKMLNRLNELKNMLDISNETKVKDIVKFNEKVNKLF